MIVVWEVPCGRCCASAGAPRSSAGPAAASPAPTCSRVRRSMGPSLPGDWLTITPSKALVHSHPYVHEDLGPSLAPVNEIGPSVAADHSNAVARINPAFVCIRVKLDAGQKNAGSAGLSGNRSHAYRFAEPRTDAADVMSTIELVDPELRD